VCSSDLLDPALDSERFGLEILKGTGVDISAAPLDPQQSKFFKAVYQNTPRIIRTRK
jgi:hypothetical protein